MTAAAPAPPDLHTIDQQITGALAGVRLARAASARSPTGQALHAEEVAQWQLDVLLERRFNAQQRTGV